MIHIILSETRNKVKGKEERHDENEASEEGKDFHNAQNLSRPQSREAKRKIYSGSPMKGPS